MSDKRSSSCIFRPSVGKATTSCGLKGNSMCQYFVRSATLLANLEDGSSVDIPWDIPLN